MKHTCLHMCFMTAIKTSFSASIAHQAVESTLGFLDFSDASLRSTSASPISLSQYAWQATKLETPQQTEV